MNKFVLDETQMSEKKINKILSNIEIKYFKDDVELIQFILFPSDKFIYFLMNRFSSYKINSSICFNNFYEGLTFTFESDKLNHFRVCPPRIKYKSIEPYKYETNQSGYAWTKENYKYLSPREKNSMKESYRGLKTILPEEIVWEIFKFC